MKKQFLSLFVVLLSVTSLFANGQKEESSDMNAELKPMVLRLAETHPADYPTTQGDYEFARLVEERTNGRIKIEVYPGSQLGEEKAVIEQVQFGAIDFTRVSIAPLTAFSENFNVLQLPYLYRNPEHMWRVLKGSVGDKFLESVIPAGFVGLSWFDGGARSFYNSVRPVKTLEDLKGLKIRVMQSTQNVTMVNSLGAVATPMPYGEVYSAIQTGVIDGAENNWPSYQSSSHYEVAQYYTLDEHTRVPEITIASKMTMDKLSAEDQKIIMQAAKDSMDFQIMTWAKSEAASKKIVEANGNEIFYLEDNSAFQAAMTPLYEAISPELQKVVEEIRAVK